MAWSICCPSKRVSLFVIVIQEHALLCCPLMRGGPVSCIARIMAILAFGMALQRAPTCSSSAGQVMCVGALNSKRIGATGLGSPERPCFSSPSTASRSGLDPGVRLRENRTAGSSFLCTKTQKNLSNHCGCQFRGNHWAQEAQDMAELSVDLVMKTCRLMFLVVMCQAHKNIVGR